MVVWAKVCELTDGFLLFVCGLYVGILTSPPSVLSPYNRMISSLPQVRADPAGVPGRPPAD